MDTGYIEKEVAEAKRTLNHADYVSFKLAEFLVGRLRSVSKYYGGSRVLIALKRELTNFNAHTGKWKND